MTVRLRITTEKPIQAIGEHYQCSGCDESFTMSFVPDYCPLCGEEIGSPAVENPRAAPKRGDSK